MPWHIEKSDGKFCVIKDDDGSKAGCHPSKAEATAQLRALYANEKQMKASVVEVADRLLTVELAETPAERALGLGGRKELELDGMLFVRPGEAPGSFSCTKMEFPILMAFFDSGGKLLAQVIREPGDGPVSPGRPFKYVLELKDLDFLPYDARLDLG